MIVRLPSSRMATTDGSCRTTPRPWTWTRTLTVPRSMAICGVNSDTFWQYLELIWPNGAIKKTPRLNLFIAPRRPVVILRVGA